MTEFERAAWIMLVTTIPAYAIYATVVVTGADGGPLHEAEYQWPMLITIGAVILANIVLGIVMGIALGMALGKGASLVDERDRQIERMGERVGSSFVVLGGVAALLMALVEWHWFWIANTLFLGFMVAGVVSSIAKVSAYRWSAR